MLRKFIGDRGFYKRVFVLLIPIMVQNGITNFVSMLDNIMIGRLGTAEMTGVAVINQLVFVFNLCIFGVVSGAGIFGAQFFGKGDSEGVRHTFRFKIIFSAIIGLLCIFLFTMFGDTLINLYLRGEGDPQSAAAALEYAKKYMYVILIGLLPYAWSQCYASTLRETGQAKIPMHAGIIAVIVNLCFNYVLIYGCFGFPALGVVGAAIATVLARFAELAIVAVWTRKNADSNSFILGAFRSMYIPGRLIWSIVLKGTPLMINETLWGAGVAMVNRCYSLRGLDVVAANNISQTFYNVFAVAFMSVGVAIGIILGQILGSGDLEGAKAESKKLIAFSVFVSIGVGVVYAVAAEFVPLMYNTEPRVKELTTGFMQLTALAMPFIAFSHSSYFTLRSGGKIAITILFDSCFMWVVNVPVVWLAVEFTNLNVLGIFALAEGTSVIKSALGAWLVGKGIWIKNIVADEKICEK